MAICLIDFSAEQREKNPSSTCREKKLGKLHIGRKEIPGSSGYIWPGEILSYLGISPYLVRKNILLHREKMEGGRRIKGSIQEVRIIHPHF